MKMKKLLGKEKYTVTQEWEEIEGKRKLEKLFPAVYSPDERLQKIM